MQANQKGFTVVEGLLLVVIVGVMVFIGWYVWPTKQTSNTTTKATTKLHSKPDVTIPDYVPNSDYSVGVKFNSTITADDCVTSTLPTGDVGCYITVRPSLIIDVRPGNAVPKYPYGAMTNFPDYPKDPTGKNVSVYVHQISKTKYTLEGSSAFYVKVTD